MYLLQDRICASRTDTNGVMKLTGAMDMLQDCSLLWLESEPSFRNYLTSHNLGMFIVSRQVDIVRLPVYGETITAKTGIFEFKSFLGYRNTVLYGENGLPCLLTWSVGAFVSMDTGRMTKLPQSEMNKIIMDEKINMEYLDKKIVLPGISGKRMEPIMVKRKDIDMYHHMNNVKYIETALELLPEDYEFKRIRIEYKLSAKLGDLLYPNIIEDSVKRYVELLDINNKPYTIIEFS